MNDELPNVWQWCGRWSRDARGAVDWAAQQFPPDIRQRGIARAYYDFLWTLNELLRVLPNGARGLRVLDVGCGAGVLALALRHLGADVTAVDRFIEYDDAFNNQMGTARDIVGRFERQGIKVQRRDVIADGLGAAPDSYDLVVSFAMIEHLHGSPKALLAAMRETLRPGGLMAITTPNLGWIRNRARSFGGRPAHSSLAEWWNPPFYGHVREFTRDEVWQMLEWSGLDVDRVIMGNWWHASSRVAAASNGVNEQWTTRFTLNSAERWKTAAALVVTAVVPSLRLSILGIGRKP